MPTVTCESYSHVQSIHVRTLPDPEAFQKSLLLPSVPMMALLAQGVERTRGIPNAACPNATPEGCESRDLNACPNLISPGGHWCSRYDHDTGPPHREAHLLLISPNQGERWSWQGRP